MFKRCISISWENTYLRFKMSSQYLLSAAYTWIKEGYLTWYRAHSFYCFLPVKSIVLVWKKCIYWISPRMAYKIKLSRYPPYTHSKVDITLKMHGNKYTAWIFNQRCWKLRFFTRQWMMKNNEIITHHNKRYKKSQIMQHLHTLMKRKIFTYYISCEEDLNTSS